MRVETAGKRIGEKVDYLELIKVIGQAKSKTTLGLFRCECGKEVHRIIENIFYYSKKRLNPASCGCMQKIKAGKAKGKKYTGKFNKQLANEYLTGQYGKPTLPYVRERRMWAV